MMNTTTATLEQLLEEGEARFPHIVGLYQWSTNYEAGQTPFTLFVDIIGYTDEHYGQTIFPMNKILTTIGYLEADYLGDALKEYASKGQSANDFIHSLITAETQE